MFTSGFATNCSTTFLYEASTTLLSQYETCSDPYTSFLLLGMILFLPVGIALLTARYFFQRKKT